MFMWIGINVSMQWVQDVFGVQSAAQIDIDKTVLQDLDTPLSKRVRGIVKKVRDERRGFLKVSSKIFSIDVMFNIVYVKLNITDFKMFYHIDAEF